MTVTIRGTTYDLMCERHIRMVLDDLYCPLHYIAVNAEPGTELCPDCVKTRLTKPSGAYPPDFGSMTLEQQNAEHEAGHAVVHHLLGHPLLAVKVVMPADYRTADGLGASGHVPYLHRPGDTFRAAIGGWAGLGAGLHRARLNGELTDSVIVGMAWSAHNDIRTIHQNLSSGQLRPSREQAFALVQQHWPVIEALGRHLLAGGNMTGDQAMIFIDKELGR